MELDVYVQKHIAGARDVWLSRYTEGGEHIFSREFEEKMAQLTEGEPKISARHMGRWLRVALIAALLLGLMISFVLTAGHKEKIRISVVDRKGEGKWQVVAETSLRQAADNLQLTIGYLPPGLKLTQKMEDIGSGRSHTYRMAYEEQMQTGRTIYIEARKMDNYNRKVALNHLWELTEIVEDSQVGDHPAKILQEGNKIEIYWAIDNYLVELHSGFSMEETMRVAKSIDFTEERGAGRK